MGSFTHSTMPLIEQRCCFKPWPCSLITRWGSSAHHNSIANISVSITTDCNSVDTPHTQPCRSRHLFFSCNPYILCKCRTQPWPDQSRSLLVRWPPAFCACAGARGGRAPTRVHSAFRRRRSIRIRVPTNSILPRRM
jgi:hypothetical protein